MDLITTIFIALGLAMDAFAVSVTTGLHVEEHRIKRGVIVALSFGFFQGFMPVIGWLAGLTLKDLITGVDHWIAFGLLFFIGVKMIYESFAIGKEHTERCFNGYIVLLLSLATSIDALAVGLSFAFLQVSIIAPVIIIAVITTVLSLGGFFAGQKLGHVFENKIEIVGGLVLIGIGIKILVEHLIA